MENYLLLASVLTNLATTEKLDGVDHMVIPVVAVKEGVLNGIFYPETAIKQFATSWNGSPVSVNHPIQNGKDASANLPKFEGTINVGKFFNAHVEDKSLKGEIWLNIEKSNRLGYQEIVKHFQANKPMEVSTGLSAMLEKTPGTHEGKAYNAVVKTIVPDHLALLPNEAGACSIADGCGALRNNAKESPCGCNKCTDTHTPVTNDTDKAVTEKVDGIINKFVTKVTDFMSNKNEKVETMNKAELIASLIANKRTQFTEADKVTLESYDLALLNKITPVEDKEPAADTKPVDKPEDVANKVDTFSAEDRALFNRLKDGEVTKIANMRVAVEKANSHLSKDDVAGLPMAVLEKMAATIQPVANYAVAGGAGAAENKTHKRASIIMNKAFDPKDEAATKTEA